MKPFKQRTSITISSQGFRVSKQLSKGPLCSTINEEFTIHPSNMIQIQKKQKNKPISSLGTENQEAASGKSEKDIAGNKIQYESVINSLLKILMTKGQKFKEISNEKGESMVAWILQSQPIKIKSQCILQKLIQQRRINLDLKGLNSSLISEVQRGLLSTLAIQINIYQKQQEFHQAKTSLSDSLRNYKSELLKQLSAISQKQ